MHFSLSHILLSDVSLLTCLFITFPAMFTAGPFPVVKQEQLSPRSSSSQADNLSTQGTSHEGASGRGKWLLCSFIQFVYMVYLSWGLVSICPMQWVNNDTHEFFHICIFSIVLRTRFTLHDSDLRRTEWISLK